jgi:hypothetical protein
MHRTKTFAGITLSALLIVFGFATTAAAASTPTLGAADTYGVLSNTFTNTAAGTTINGDVGFTTGPAVVPGGTHANYGSGAPYATAGANQGTALSSLASQPCTFTFAAGAIDLAADTTHGPIGVYTPGVYCTAAPGAASIGTAGITLSGAGTYIFRIDGALTSVSNSVVTLSGANACDVFWTPTAATTLGDNSTFFGTIIDDAGISLGNVVNWVGRALSFGGTVTSVTSNTITTPTCSTTGTINVVKTVVNDNGSTKVVADFPLFVNGSPVTSGATNAYAPGAYTVTETSDTNLYARTFSGDCDVNGHITLATGQSKICTITNNDVPPAFTGGNSSSGGSSGNLTPPLISVIKVPTPLSLPNGAGSVTYNYTLKNTGKIQLMNITMVDDSCTPLKLGAGDVNNNSILEPTETWSYSCTSYLTSTHTNTVVATGWANGISATDIANATVVVGKSIVPPLINVTKVPLPMNLPAGGGIVTYTEKITNPGKVSLSNIKVSDDKCGPVQYISGDVNNNKMLDISETWTYLCTTRLSQTTTNTVVATGDANGFTARDFAIVTVPVGTITPMLPNTGIAPYEDNTIRNVLLAIGAAAALFFISWSMKHRKLNTK